MTTDLGPIVDALMADFERQDQRLSEDDVLRIATKRSLSTDQLKELLGILRSKGIDLKPAETVGWLPNSEPRSFGRQDPLLQRYLRDISQFRLLTAQDEVRIARRIQAGLQAQAGLADPCSPEVVHLIEDGRVATAQLVAANLRLVFSIAKKLAYRANVEVLDLAQDGVFGLARAAALFDPSLGFKFSTYATWWIRQSMLRGIADKGRTIRLPVHVQERLGNIRRVRRALMKEKGGVEPSLTEISEQIGVPEAKIQFLMDVSRETMSFDDPVTNDSIGPLLGILHSGKNSTPEEIAVDNQISSTILRLVDDLKPNEARVLRLRFGLDDGIERTLEEVGQIMGVTRERIRQVQNKALGRLRHPVRAGLLKGLAQQSNLGDL